MAVVLLTGMSGVGKSTVLGELARLGHRVVDTDRGGWIEAGSVAGQAIPEPLWRADRITALLDGHAAGHLFLAGTVANQGAFYDRFAAVVLLTVPVDVALDRLGTRTTNDFGKRDAERARVVADFAEVEPLLRRRATLVIDTRRPLTEVVAAVLHLVQR